MISPDLDISTRRYGPLLAESQFRDTKDPCPVYDYARRIWHMYGSGGSVGGEVQEKWSILHATAPTIAGPWTEHGVAELQGLSGDHIAAPGVVYDQQDDMLHMLVQTEFLEPGGTIEYLTSKDGETFEHQGTALEAILGTEEAALYDPHPTIIKGWKYMTYSGSDFIGKLEVSDALPGWEPSVGMPDIYLAKSKTNTWAGPWDRLGKILDHKEVPHHNQRDQQGYEWGLEGSQLIQLDKNIIAMNAVCFLPNGKNGTRQRVFMAFADNVAGPYHTIGPVLPPPDDGENGHAALVRDPFQKNTLLLAFQERKLRPQDPPPHLGPWHYGIAELNTKSIKDLGAATLKYHEEVRRATTYAQRSPFSEKPGILSTARNLGAVARTLLGK